MATVNLVALLGSFGTATMIIMQLVKLVFEKVVPGITLSSNKTLHDRALQFIQYGINLVLVIMAARFGGSVGAQLFAGWQWWDFMFAAFGSAMTSQAVYSIGSQGGSPTVPTTTVSLTGGVVPPLNTTAVPLVMTPDPTIPTVSR